ncbi:MAG TPA: hypothetical protein VH988_18090 [Thermoanaerobaculia bacterium]|nr:hypothetical protein [Thermoanaerobaculia bacterium]
MKGFLALLVREVAERWLLLAGAVAVGFFPLLVPLLPGVPGGSSVETRAGIALALCLTVNVVLAVILGASVIAGELAERRLGFYFSRPVAGWAVWAGKLAGAAVLSIGAALLVLLPTLVVDHRIELNTPMPWWIGSAWIGRVPPFAGVLVSVCLLLLLLSHLVSTMVRSRSPWLLLDLAAALTAAALFWSSRQTLANARAVDALGWGLAAFTILLAAAAALASAIQVTCGRTDARRSHRLLSLVFWSGLGVVTAGFAVYAHWVVDVSPADLQSFEAVLAAPSGPWVGLRGPALRRGNYFPSFLFDTTSGRAFKIGTSPADRFWWQQPVFSADGSHAAWLEVVAGGYELRALDLSRTGRPVASTVSFADWSARLALSPRGRLLAAVQGSVLTVDDLEARRLVASIPLGATDDQRFQVRFLDDRHLRLYEEVSERSPGGAPVWRLSAFDLDLDAGHGRLIRTGGIELPGGRPYYWTIGPDGWRLVLRSQSGPILLADLRTGTLVATLPRCGVGSLAVFLADGRLLLDQRSAGGAMLCLLDRDGAELRRMSFPGLRVAVGGEVQPGRLAMATAPQGSLADPAGWSAFLLDLDTGQRVSIGPDLLPTLRDLTPFDRGAASPQSIGPRLFLKKGGELVLLDPATGHLRTLLHIYRG